MWYIEYKLYGYTKYNNEYDTRIDCSHYKRNIKELTINNWKNKIRKRWEITCQKKQIQLTCYQEWYLTINCY